MRTHADRAQKNQSKSVSSVFSDKLSDAQAASQLVDNRPEAMAQKGLKEIADHSPQTLQAVQFQELANDRYALMAKIRKNMLEREATPEEIDGVEKKTTITDIPDRLKAGLEQLSGLDLSSIRVHYNSTKPAKLYALAYTQGRDIYVGPGQEQYLPHEGWHAVQQQQGRVKPTLQAKDIAISDDVGLEREADVMGAKALQIQGSNLTETSALRSEAIGATGEKARLDFLSTSSYPPAVQLKTTAMVTSKGLELNRDGDLQRLYPGFDFSGSYSGKNVYRHMSPKSLRLDAAEVQLQQYLAADSTRTQILNAGMNLMQDIQARATSWENYVEGQNDQFQGPAEPNAKLSDTYDSIIIHWLISGSDDVPLAIVQQEWGALARQLAYKDLKHNDVSRLNLPDEKLVDDIMLEARRSLSETASKLGLPAQKEEQAIDLLIKKIQNSSPMLQAIGGVYRATILASGQILWEGRKHYPSVNADGTESEVYSKAWFGEVQPFLTT